MILITGGAYHGKRNYAKQMYPGIDFVDGISCAEDTIFACQGMDHFHSYIENRMIWDELNYYQQNKSLLGKHPIFNEFKRRKELLGLPIKELVKRQKQIENNIWRVTNELNKGDKPHLDIERRERLAGYKAELEEVNRLLE